ncbi:Uncharacterised protein [Salmonella enterica]|uniref:Uncharacterized protein n=1 Tax=Salmonella enterica TaxID=28901 RepID=A0A379QHX2_SALER|nr:Uncharacterised protein [Salmonella enterica]
MFTFIKILAVMAVLYYGGFLSVSISIQDGAKTYVKTFDRATH